MSYDFTFAIKSLRFDEDYRPTEGTRLTTNFANLARGDDREQNLRNALKMIDNRCNDLVHWDNPQRDRYSVELDIISVDVDLEGTGETFPTIEILNTTLYDRKTDSRKAGIVGNNFSSFVRDYDFSIVLQEYNKNRSDFGVPDDFGDLHAKLFKSFIASSAYRERFQKPPVICISVSDNKTYIRTTNEHPVLGVEYEPNEASLTEQYFRKMGLNVRYFMPSGSTAPFAFFFIGDLLNDYTNLELISTISTMETFQRIYRPEIYNANSVAGPWYKPSLKHQDFSNTQVVYDREERARLAVQQGQFTEQHFIKPHQAILEQWLNNTPSNELIEHNKAYA